MGYLRTYTEQCFPEAWARFRAREDNGGVGQAGGPGDEGDQTNRRQWGGHWSKRWTLVGPEIEQKMRDEPQSGFARRYRVNMRALVEDVCGPLSDLINRYGQHLQHWGDKEAYKKKFPCAANNGMLRNLFPVQFVRWTIEMKQICRAWDRDDFTDMWPQVNPFPACIWSHFTSMVTMIREEEVKFGLASHKIIKDVYAIGGDTHGMTAEEEAAYHKQREAARAGQKKKAASVEENKNKKKKYVVKAAGAAASVVTGTVVAAAVSVLLSGIDVAEAANHVTNTITVETPMGPVRGISDLSTGTEAFMGLPYAEPPVGSRGRWQPPRALAPWAPHTFDATRGPGPSCWQRANPGVGEMSEDCLHLHVWRPSHQADADDATAPAPAPPLLLPVLVYLHGGSLVEGSAVAIQSGYGGPASLANRTHHSSVNVALNYRLGTLGFLALRELADADARAQGVSGNYGLLDVLEALRWIQRNIQSFGGDPARVTVYGQSSGGSLVFALMTSPNAVGLFANAISMSGSPRMNSTFAEAADYWHQEVVAGTPCKANASTPNTKPLRDCLLALKPAQLVAAMPYDWDPGDGWSHRVFWDTYRYAPLLVIDGHVLPTDYRSPSKATKTPLSSNIALIIGVTREEIDFAPGDDVRNMSLPALSAFLETALSNSSNPENAPMAPAAFARSVLDAYGLPENPIEGERAPRELIFSDVISDATMLCGTYALADKWSEYRQALAVGAPIYMYAVSQRPGNPFCALNAFSHLDHPYCPQFSFHAVDMFALFGWLPPARTPGHTVIYNTTRGDVQWTELLRTRLIDQFAYSSRVESPWRPYRTATGGASASTRHVVDFNVDNERVVVDLREQQCQLFLDQKFYSTKVWVN